MQFKKKFIIFIVFILLGFAMSMQYNTSTKIINKDFTSTHNSQRLINELKNLRKSKEILNEELAELNRLINQYEISESREEQIVRNLKNDISNQELLIGYRESTGPGIIITIENLPYYDTFYTEEDIDLYSREIILKLILGIINVLNISGAEAISINDQRYISTTEIYYKSNAIQINSVPVTFPLTIKAIGNSNDLESALNIKHGLIWDATEYFNFQIDTRKEKDITIPKYNKIIQYQYAKPLYDIE